MEKGDYERAIQDCNRSIELNDKNSFAYNNRGWIYCKKRDYDRAWADVRKCRELGGNVDSKFLAELSKATAKDLTTQEQLTAEEIQNIVTKSTAGQFASPLAEKTLSEFLVAESNKTGVPVWLVLAQAKRETSFGSPQNGTVQDGRTFEDGTKGNAHNLFNIRPGSSWTGKKLDLGPGSGEFRVYDSYQDSIRDYMRLMSSSLYKGLTLHGLVYKYFPPSDNDGSAATERYIDGIINFAASQGITITRDTVVVP